jgi:hypothetical protein
MLKRKAIKMKVTTEKVIGFETNPYKQTCRNILKGIIADELGHKETITGASLCGASAEFENQVVRVLPQSKIFCIENNKQTAKIVSQKLPKDGSCELVVDSWRSLGRTKIIELDWMWADFCCNPTFDNCLDVRREMCFLGDTEQPKVYAVTFDLGCRSIKGGSARASESLFEKPCYGGSQTEWKQFLERKRIEDNKEKTIGLIKHIIRFLATPHFSFDKGYMPHTVIFYGGGKNKNNPCVPMLTMIYCLNDKYKITNQRWSWKREAGYEVTKFINLFDVKNGKTELTTNEGVTKMKVKNVVKVIKAMQTTKQKSEGKSPVMIRAGHKAWETRRKNEQKRKQSAAGHKAWETRRKNELAWLK